MNRTRNQSKRSGNRKHKNANRGKRRGMVFTQGMGEPQVRPFMPDRRITKKVIRFAVPKVAADANGNFLHRISLRNPARAFDGTGTYEDVVNLSNVYDMYKPIALRVEMVPAFATATFSVPSIIAAADYDDLDTSQQVTTLAVANQYNERQILDPRRKSIVHFKIPTLQSGSIPGITSTAPATVQAGGFLDFQGPPFDGVAYLVGVGFPANLVVYDIFLEMDILLKFAR